MKIMMIKLAPLVLMLAAVSAGECPNDQSHTCDCFTCDNVETMADGSMIITVGHCKSGTISWMCCTAVDGVAGVCDVEYPCDGPKCTGIGADGFTVKLPPGSQSFEINTHDGQTEGDARNVNEICGGTAGGQGGSCVDAATDTTAHCLITFDIATQCGPIVEPLSIVFTTTEDAPTTTDDVPTTTSKPGTQGDPHFKTHGGEMYDFHGGCDLVLLKNPDFRDGLGMTIHIRTKIETWWSRVEAAVVQIGDETFEIQMDQFHHNGTAIDMTKLDNHKPVVTKLAGLTLRYMRVGENIEAHLYLGKGHEKMLLKTFKGFVKVGFDLEDSEYYKGSVGMLGRVSDGKRVGRDGETFIKEINAFGQEWQVLSSEPKLFHTYDDAWVVPAGQQCAMPDQSATTVMLRKRRLTNGVASEAAEAACSHLKSADDRAACVYDVIATQDIDMAGAY